MLFRTSEKGTLRMAENVEQFFTYKAKNWYTLRKIASLLINRGNFENSNFGGKFEKKTYTKKWKIENRNFFSTYQKTPRLIKRDSIYHQIKKKVSKSDKDRVSYYAIRLKTPVVTSP